MGRKNKVIRHLNRKGFGLEIGPSHSPITPKSKGYKVEIIDHMSKAGLLRKYQDQPIRLHNIEDVDYIWEGQSYAELTGKKSHYDWIIASHLIEHTPDLIAFINNCDEILKNDGVLSLVIPDKRYCFDRFRPLTGLGQIIDASSQAHTQHSPGAIAEYFLNVVHLNGEGAWDSKTSGEFKFVHTLTDTQAVLKASKTNETYLDVHAWCFVPHSFRLLVQDLYDLGYINLREVGFEESVGGEFYMTLGRGGASAPMSRLEMLETIEKELSGEYSGKPVSALKRLARKCLKLLQKKAES